MTRKIWLDYSRAFACVLVALGHLIMSFEGNVLAEDNLFASIFINTIYHFHVYIFFFCSGYLFQLRFIKYSDRKEYAKQKIIRCLDFGVPYVVVSFITFIIKTVLASSVNSPVDNSFFHVLLLDPINQMWYLYAIIVITIITPIIKSDKALPIILTMAIGSKMITFFPSYSAPTPIDYWLQHQIWFVLGMVWAHKRIALKNWLSFTMMGGFFILCMIEFAYGIDNEILDALLTFLGIISSVEIIRMLTSEKQSLSFVWKYLTKYMFQIYLLHTICAAGIRIILLKVGITNLMIHIGLGVVFSFILPIVCAIIAERTKVFNIIFFPSKTIQLLKQQRKV